MKLELLLCAGVSAFSLVSAEHGHHAHARFHRHHARAVTPRSVSATALAFELDGHTVPEAEVRQGIENGTLIFAPGERNPFSVASKAPTSSVGPTSASLPMTTAGISISSSIALSIPTSIPTSIPSAVGSSSSKAVDAAPSAYGDSGSPSTTSGSLTGIGVDKEFPDGQISCSEFPEQYGAVNLAYLKLGGWSGIQKGQMMSGGYGNIETVVSSQCSGANCCTDGSYCSYACPAGYQKSQWPQTQGNTGQSVGGIQCKNGKLWLTNKALSNKLCVPGSEQVSVKVLNKMTKNVAICRTDYPGTESQTVPLDALPGQTENVTCPNQEKYYNWLGKQTSAQYYVNPAGVPVEKACQWATPGSKMGNFAPLNIGVGFTSNRAWLSIFQNAPTTTDKLEYTVELVGDNLSGKCRYKNGKYCSGANYETCNDQGCTSSASSGTITYVLSD